MANIEAKNRVNLYLQAKEDLEQLKTRASAEIANIKA